MNGPIKPCRGPALPDRVRSTTNLAEPQGKLLRKKTSGRNKSGQLIPKVRLFADLSPSPRAMCLPIVLPCASPAKLPGHPRIFSAGGRTCSGHAGPCGCLNPRFLRISEPGVSCMCTPNVPHSVHPRQSLVSVTRDIQGGPRASPGQAGRHDPRGYGSFGSATGERVDISPLSSGCPPAQTG